MDVVAVGQRVAGSLEDDDADAVAAHRAAGLRVERPGVAVGRGDAVPLEEVAVVQRHRDRAPAGQRHVALAGHERLARVVHGDERRRARGGHRDRRPREPELVGHPGGEEVGVVAEPQVERVGLGDDVGVGEQVREEVRGAAHPAEHAHRPADARRVVAGALERLPRAFEEGPVLRVHERGFPRRVAEEVGVEPVSVVEATAGRDVPRVVEDRGRDPRGAEPVAVEPGDRLDAVAEVLPERLRVARAGEAAGEADDGDRVEGLVHGHRRPARRRSL